MTKPRDWYRVDAKAGADTAEISIFDVIGGGFFADEDAVTGKRVAAQLDALPESIKTIRVRVNSPGGAVFDALHIANALRRQSSEKGRTVEALIEGIAASAATLITSAADVIRMPKNAVMMIHMPSGLAMGPASAMRKTADALDRVTDGIVATYRWVSQESPDAIRQMMAETSWFNADEALAHGFITEVVDAVEATALLDPLALEAVGQIPDAYRARLDALTRRPAVPAPAPQPADAKAVIQACREAGFAELAEDLLGQPMEVVTAKLADATAAKKTRDDRATEIRQLCQMAGKSLHAPARHRVEAFADHYIAAGMAIPDVRAQLTALTALLDGVEIDGRQDPNARADSRRTDIDLAAVYAQRNRRPGQGA